MPCAASIRALMSVWNDLWRRFFGYEFFFRCHLWNTLFRIYMKQVRVYIDNSINYHGKHRAILWRCVLHAPGRVAWWAATAKRSFGFSLLLCTVHTFTIVPNPHARPKSFFLLFCVVFLILCFFRLFCFSLYCLLICLLFYGSQLPLPLFHSQYDYFFFSQNSKRLQIMCVVRKCYMKNGAMS